MAHATALVAEALSQAVESRAPIGGYVPEEVSPATTPSVALSTALAAKAASKSAAQKTAQG